jgi:ATP-binding cassette subfamily B protein
MILGTFAEVLSLTAVIPFLAMLTAPERVFNQPYFANIAGLFGITSANQMILNITSLFVFTAILAGSYRIVLLWLNSRLTSAFGSELSINIYRRIIYQPYHVHLSSNSSSVISGITYKVNSVINGIISPLLTLISSVLVLFSIIITLILISPIVALVSIFVFGISYSIIAWVSRNRLKRNSKCISFNQTQTTKILQESLEGIRDIILGGYQLFYSDRFRKADISLKRADLDNNFIGQNPRYVMEVIVIVSIAILTFNMSRQSGGIEIGLPILGAMGIGSLRLLPALQQIYNSWVKIVSNNAQLFDIITTLEQPAPMDLPSPSPLLFKSRIQIKNLQFKYKNNTSWILDGINISIPKGARVGFIGKTGAGKSTLLDVIMGLLIPTMGEILIDEELVLGEALRSWQRSIAHVPQSIYLADCSISENIAFGVPLDSIDMERVKDASKIAQISDFIESIPDRYDAMVGERGVQISGGQRQRIGIARALYKQSEVIVFDEATSALDGISETAIQKTLSELHGEITIITVAHRFTTIQNADEIFLLDNGELVSRGSYAALLEISPLFRRLAFEDHA